MNIVLVEPEISANTGNVARLCTATKSGSHLIEPFGFKLDDSQLKRGRHGLLAARGVAALGETGRRLKQNFGERAVWFIECVGGGKIYNEVKFSPDDYLVSDARRRACRNQLLEQHREQWLRIPIVQRASALVDLSNCVALVLFEALRQQDSRGDLDGGR